MRTLYIMRMPPRELATPTTGPPLRAGLSRQELVCRLALTSLKVSGLSYGATCTRIRTMIGSFGPQTSSFGCDHGHGDGCYLIAI